MRNNIKTRIRIISAENHDYIKIYSARLEDDLRYNIGERFITTIYSNISIHAYAKNSLKKSDSSKILVNDI